MQSTGQYLTQAVSQTPTQGSVITYDIAYPLICLKKTTQIIVKRFQGKLPDNLEDLKSFQIACKQNENMRYKTSMYQITTRHLFFFAMNLMTLFRFLFFLLRIKT